MVGGGSCSTATCNPSPKPVLRCARAVMAAFAVLVCVYSRDPVRKTLLVATLQRGSSAFQRCGIPVGELTVTAVRLRRWLLPKDSGALSYTFRVRDVLCAWAMGVAVRASAAIPSQTPPPPHGALRHARGENS